MSQEQKEWWEADEFWCQTPGVDSEDLTSPNIPAIIAEATRRGKIEGLEEAKHIVIRQSFSVPSERKVEKIYNDIESHIQQYGTKE